MRFNVSKPCTRQTADYGTCLQLFAVEDAETHELCAGCTTRLMAALDVYSDEPLNWSDRLQKQAQGGE